MKKRLDQLLVDLGLADAITKARGLVLAGQVLVQDQCVDKPAKLIDPAVPVRLKETPQKYVGRGGLKLEAALQEFKIDPVGRICLDVGASTGGFTDCLLQHGAKKVYAVDVGYGQLAWKLRQNPHVVVVERQNIRHLSGKVISEKVALAVIDVSFISLKLVLPAVKIFLASPASVVALIKPQFEVRREQVEKKGVVKDSKRHEAVVEEIKKAGIGLGWFFQGLVTSPILGAEGNKEFLIYFQA